MSNSQNRHTYRVTDYRHNNGKGKLIYAQTMEDAAWRFAQDVYGGAGFERITRRSGSGQYRIIRRMRGPVNLTITRVS